MKAEAWIFPSCTIFLVLVTPAYWIITDASEHGGDWTGTSALTMTTLLTLLVTIYHGFHARNMDPRPGARKEADVAGGGGGLVFFPPYSWWPLWMAMALGTAVFAVAAGTWWLL